MNTLLKMISRAFAGAGAVVGFCAVVSLALATPSQARAELVASWTDFGGELTQGSYTLDLGSSTVDDDGVVTIGTGGLTISPVLNAFTVVVECELPEASGAIASLSIGSTIATYWDNAEMQLEHWHNGGIYSGGVSSAYTAKPKRIALAYGKGVGTQTFADGLGVLKQSALMSSSANVSSIRIGARTETEDTLAGAKIKAVYLYDTKVTEWPAEVVIPAPANPGIIGLNFASGRAPMGAAVIDQSTLLGFVDTAAGKGGQITIAQWNKLGGASGSVMVTDSAETPNSYALEFSSPNVWDVNGNDSSVPDGAIAKLIHGYLDSSGGNIVNISLAGMPTSGYDVAIIASGDNDGAAPKFAAFTVNGTQYTVVDGKTTLGNAGWGTRNGALTALTEGENVLYVSAQRASILRITGSNTNGRGSLAAVMVFPKAAPAPIEVSGETATSTLWTEGETPEQVTLNVKDGATLTIDSALATSMLTLNFEGSATVQMAEGGSVSAGLTAIFIDKGDVTIPLALANGNLTSASTVNPITVGAGRTLTIDAGTAGGTLYRAVAGAGKWVKIGSGDLTLESQSTAAGGIEVHTGTLKLAENNANCLGTASGSHADIRVKGGATLDMNGQAATWLRTVTLEAGATFKNSGEAIGQGDRQMVNVTLEGDATIDAASNFGFIANSHGATALNLGGYTVTKRGAGSFWLSNTTVTNGRLLIEEGTVLVTSHAVTMSNTVTVEVAAGGAFRAEGNVNVSEGGSLTTKVVGELILADGTFTTNALEGSGSVHLTNGMDLAAATTSAFGGTVEVNDGSVLTLPTHTLDTKVLTDQVTLLLNQGGECIVNGGFFFPKKIEGEGTLTIAADSSIGCGNDFDFTMDTHVVVAEGKTLHLRPWSDNKVYEFCSLTFKDANGVVTRDTTNGGSAQPRVTIARVSGAGTLGADCQVTFTDKATMVVGTEPLKIADNATVTYAGEFCVEVSAGVNLPAEGLKVLSAKAAQLPKAVTVTGVTSLADAVIREDGIYLVVTAVSYSTGTTPGETSAGYRHFRFNLTKRSETEPAVEFTSIPADAEAEAGRLASITMRLNFNDTENDVLTRAVVMDEYWRVMAVSNDFTIPLAWTGEQDLTIEFPLGEELFDPAKTYHLFFQKQGQLAPVLGTALALLDDYNSSAFYCYVRALTNEDDLTVLYPPANGTLGGVSDALWVPNVSFVVTPVNPAAPIEIEATEGATLTLTEAQKKADIRFTHEENVVLNFTETVDATALFESGSGDVTLRYVGFDEADYIDLLQQGKMEIVLATGLKQLSSEVLFDFDAPYAMHSRIVQRLGSSGSAVVLMLEAPAREFIEDATRVLSINFSDNNNGVVPVGTQEGIIPTDGANWITVSGNNNSKRDFEISGSEGSPVVAWTCKEFYRDVDNPAYIQKRYLDDGGSGVTLALSEMTNFSEAYALYLYMATDNGNGFPAIKVTVDGTSTYYRMEGETSVIGSGTWGSASNPMEVPTLGTNVIRIPAQVAEAMEVQIVRPSAYSAERGSVGALQIVGANEKGLRSLSKATLGGATATWESLSWTAVTLENTDEDGRDIYLLELTGDTTLDEIGALPVEGALLVICAPTTCRLTVTNDATANPRMALADTVQIVLSGDQEVPANIVLGPGRVVYTSPKTNITSSALYEIELTNGFTGTITRGGEKPILFTGGEVVLPALNTETESWLNLEVSGNTTVTTGTEGNEALVLAQASLTLGGNSVTTVPLLRCGGASATKTKLTLRDHAQLKVTDGSATDQGSISVRLAEWPTTVTQIFVRDDATIEAKGFSFLRDRAHANLIMGGNAVIKADRWGAFDNPNADLVMSATAALFQNAEVQIGGEGFYSPYNMPHMTGREHATLTALESFTISGTPHFSRGATALTFKAAAGAELRIENFAAWTLNEAFVPTIAGEGCVLLAARPLTTLRMQGGEMGIFGGEMAVGDLQVEEDMSWRLRRLVTSNAADGGYLVLETVPDLSDVAFSLWLDPNRDVDTYMTPRHLLIKTDDLDTDFYFDNWIVYNNKNKAITSATLVAGTYDLQSGYFVELKGEAVLDSRVVEIDANGYTLRQETVGDLSQIIFEGTVQNAVLSIPSGGINLGYASFAGSNPIVIKALGTTPETLLRGESYTFPQQVTFDLTTWTTAEEGSLSPLGELALGAVRGVPASVCLISGGVEAYLNDAELDTRFDFSFAEGYVLPDGVTQSLEVTHDGLYLVFTSETRLAKTINVNLTTADTLFTSPSVAGAYSVSRVGWNTLSTGWAGLVKVAVPGGTLSSEEATFATLMETVGQNDAAATALFKRWAEPSEAYSTATVSGIPFARYRVAVVMAGAAETAFAPVTVNGEVLTADAEGGYTRQVGDTQWGDSNVTDATTLGQNTVVSNVMSGERLTLTFVPKTLAETRGTGIAVIQIIEVPEAVAESAAATYSLTLEAGETTLVSDGTMWANGALNTLNISCNVDATLILPDDFTAKTVVANGTGTLTLRGAAIAVVDIVDLSAVAKAVLDVPVTFDHERAKHMTYEKYFDNNGAELLIASDETVVLGADSGITTDIESPDAYILQIDSNSSGLLRREAPLQQDRTGVDLHRYLTYGYKQVHFTTIGEYGTLGLCVEEGDKITSNGNLWSQYGFTYTQTGGELHQGNTTSTGTSKGFLVGVSGKREAVLNISGGLFRVASLVAWAGTEIDVNVSGTGIVSLYDMCYLHGSGARETFTFTEKGTLELRATTFTVGKDGNGVLEVNFNGGRLTTTQTETSIQTPFVFNGSEESPTQIDTLGTILFTEANTGSGHIEVTQGTLAVSNVAALGETTVHVKSHATYEVRVADMASGTVILEDGACVRITIADTTETTFKIANALQGDASKVRFFLNGAEKTATLDADAGTITFTGDATSTVTALEWNDAVVTGTWAHGTSGPWKSDATYYNGDEVTFPATTTPQTVTMEGSVRPAKMTFGDMASASYTFTTGEEGVLMVPAGADTTVTLPPATYDVPLRLPDGTTSFISTTAALGSTLRLFGPAAAKEVEFSGVFTQADGVAPLTLAPAAGEKQTILITDANFRGADTMTLTKAGEGTVLMRANGTTNAAFKGKIVVEQGVLEMSQNTSQDNLLFALNAAHYQFDDPFITVKSGATLRPTSRQFWGGWRGDGFPEAMLNSVLVRIDEGGLLDDISSETNHLTRQVAFAGDNATFKYATTDLRWKRGAGFVVGNVTPDATEGESGTVTSADFDAYVESSQALSLNDGDVAAAIQKRTVNVKDNARLHFKVDISGALTAEKSIEKIGTGRWLLEQPTTNGTLYINVNEGALGGSSRLENSTVVVKGPDAEATQPITGGTLEAGLSVAKAIFEEGAKIAIDPTGSALLHMDAFEYPKDTLGKALPIKVVLRADKTQDDLRNEPVRVMSWSSGFGITAESFVLEGSDDFVTNYLLEVRDNALYLKPATLWTRDLTWATETNVSFEWYATAWEIANNALPWTHKGTSNLDYAPADNEAPVVIFTVPSATTGVTIQITKAVNVSQVKFRDADGNTLTPVVTYVYKLHGEEVAPGEARTYTWIPTLAVTGTTTLATVEGVSDAAYATAVAGNSVTLYCKDDAYLALNLNFCDTNGIDANARAVGMVPFAGVYWNNLSPLKDNAYAQTADATLTAYRKEAMVLGLEKALPVTYFAVNGILSQSALATTYNGTLLADGLKGQTSTNVDALLTAAGLSTPMHTQYGWHVKVENLPLDTFRVYDLYLIFTGTGGDACTFPAVAIKTVSDTAPEAWQYFSNRVLGTMASSSGVTATWNGSTTLTAGQLEKGQQILHIRVTNTTGTLEICGADTGLADAATYGLAALQIVPATDGVGFARAAFGKWSSSDWTRYDATGSSASNQPWADATEENPYVAELSASSIDVNMPATASTLNFKAIAALTGSEALTTGALDLTALNGTLTVTSLETTHPLQVIYGSGSSLSLITEEPLWSIDWGFATDRAASLTSSPLTTTATNGAIELMQMPNMPVNIHSGDLILNYSGATTYIQPVVSGDTTGSLIKRGTGTFWITGNGLQLPNATVPFIVEEGFACFASNVSGTMGSGKTLRAMGATSELNFDAGDQGMLPGNTTLHATDGGILSAGRPNIFGNSTREVDVLLEGGTWKTNLNGGTHIKIRNLTLRGEDNVVLFQANGDGNAWGFQGLLTYGVPSFEAGTHTLLARTPEGGALPADRHHAILFNGNSGIVNLAAGAEVTSAIAATSGDAATVTFQGGGTWRQTAQIFSSANDSLYGKAFVLDGVTFSYDLAGATHGVYTETTQSITVKNFATLGGAVTFDGKAPIIVEATSSLQGGTINNNVRTGTMKFASDASLSLAAGATLVCDLSRADPCFELLATENLVTTGITWGEPTICIENFSNVTLPRKLIAWPTDATNKPTAKTLDVSTWKCTEAIALDAILEVRDDGIYLASGNIAYTWNGGTAEAAWNTASWTKPADATSDWPNAATSPARIVSEATITVDGSYNVADLILMGEDAIRLEALAGTSDVDTITLAGELWKFDDGITTIAVPLYTANNAEVASAITVNDGTLVIAAPIDEGTAPRGGNPITVAEDATLRLDGVTQTLSNVAGAGMIAIEGADVTMKVTTTDSDLLYLVDAEGSLTVNSTLPNSAPARTATRTLGMASGAAVTFDGEYAFGQAPSWYVWSMEDPTVTEPVTLTLESAPRFAGTIAAYAPLVATGTLRLKGDTTLETTANMTLDTLAYAASTTGTIRKTEAGTLTLTGLVSAAYPMEVEAGVLALTGDTPINIADGLTPAHWTVHSGATLAFGGSGLYTLGSNGIFTVRNGATLSFAKPLTAQSRTVLEQGTTLRFMSTEGRFEIASTLTVEGTAFINLDALAATILDDANATTAYTLIALGTNGRREGAGRFRLTGESVNAFMAKGWTLVDKGSAVTLEYIGGNAYVYTGDSAEWKAATWYDGSTSTPVVWPTAGGVAASLGETNPLSEVGATIANRSLSWGNTTTLSDVKGLFVTAETAPYTLSGKELRLSGHLTKLGSANLELATKLVFEAEADTTSGSTAAAHLYGLNLLGGTTTVKGALTDLSSAVNAPFSGPITMNADADASTETVLDIANKVNTTLAGLIDGAGATLRKSDGETTILTIAQTANALAKIDILKGTLKLASADTTITPKVVLAEDTTLTYAPTETIADDVTFEQFSGDKATFHWNANASNALGSETAPMLAPLDVKTFIYESRGGNLVVGTDTFPETVAWQIKDNGPSRALWLNSDVTIAALEGAGNIEAQPLGTEDGERTLTVNLAQDATYAGAIKGATTLSSHTIKTNLSVRGDGAADPATLTLTGTTPVQRTTGTLRVTDAEVMLDGTWGGDVVVEANGVLSGRGQLNGITTATTVKAQGALSAATIGERILANGSTDVQRIPSVLTGHGSLAFEEGAVIEVLLRTDYANNAQPWVSCINTQTLTLPATSSEYKLDVILDTKESDATQSPYTTSSTILTWKTLNGALNINGNVYDSRKDYEEGKKISENYILRQEGSTLKLQRTGGRFWFFVY